MSSIFSAEEASLGYLYQIRYGLKLLLSEEVEDAVLLIENIDDISIQTSLTTDVYQTKFHLNNPPNVTNASVEFWKTIRIWCDMITSGEIDVNKCVFTLITTAAAAPSSLLFKLRFDSGKRDIDKILEEMLAVANTSVNLTNQSSYVSFKSLLPSQQKKLISNIVVVDSSDSINKAKEQILLSLRIVSKNFSALFDRVEGWFLGQVILQLQQLRPGISFKELQQVIWDIAETLKADNLPADFTSSIVGDEAQLSTYRNLVFVKQLDIVGISPNLINHAISDYHRAFSQTSKWIREGLISPTDEIKYHDKLQEDWDRKFSVLCALVDNEEEEKSIERGKLFYQNFYVLQHPMIHIKDRFKESYMITGSCHMLSNDKKIGWHPEYKNIL